MHESIASGLTYALDFEPVCKCGGRATHYLEIHAVDYCTTAKRTWVELLCAACLGRSVAQVANIVADGEEWCSSCGTPLLTLSDIIVTAQPIDKG